MAEKGRISSLPLSPLSPFSLSPSFPPPACSSRKLPLFALAAAASVATIVAQNEAMKMNAYVSLPWRIGNALVSYVAYLGQLFWPTGLAVFYPHPENHLPSGKWPALSGVGGHHDGPWPVGGVPICSSAGCGIWGCWCRRSACCRSAVRPWPTVTPTCRRSGCPLPWPGELRISRSWPYRRWVCGIGAALVMASLMVCAWLQTSYWRNSETLWTHAVACTSRNAKAHCYLGMVCPTWANSTRPSSTFGRPWKSSPTTRTPGSISTWLSRRPRFSPRPPSQRPPAIRIPSTRWPLATG